MYNVDKFKEIIQARLSEERYIHSLNVAESAFQLAGKYGADPEKAYIAGVLHDIMKEESIDVQLRYIEAAGESLTPQQRQAKNVYHQLSGAAYCKLELGIEDPEILLPIRYHTTGRAGMSLAEKVLFTADFISADRCYPDVEIMRSKAQQSLEEAMLYALKYTIQKLTAQETYIHIDTVKCYNSILSEMK